MITNTFAKYLITLTFLILMFYGTFVFRHVFYTPEIILNQPTYIETKEPTLLLSGTVKHLTTLSINNKPLLFEQTGNFKQLRTLSDGISAIEIVGEDKFSRVTSITIIVNKLPSPDSPIPQIEPLETENQEESQPE